MMDDELDRITEPPTSSARAPAPARLELMDVAGAIGAAEAACRSRVFGDPDGSACARALSDAMSSTSSGERAAAVAPAEQLAAMRETMRRFSSARSGLVVHALAGDGSEHVSALADLGWGVLAAAGPEDSFDLSLVARRAAEDSGVPFVVVHGLGQACHAAGRAVAMVGIPHEESIARFLGDEPPLRAKADARAPAGDRALASRVPFALGAALRELGALSGRRQDLFDKVPLGEAGLVLVGAGPVGDALLCATGELRGRGYDVAAVRVTSLRPFPGARLIKALGRALAVTVLEPSDEPFAHGALLARDVKSAFSDALTWVPGFPGIGRIPKLFVGASGPAFDVDDLAAACENMLADERGRRTFSFVDVDDALPRVPRLREASPEARGEREVAIRFVLDAPSAAESVLSAVSRALASAVGLRAQCIITSGSGEGAVLDVVASRDRARGGMARRAPRLVVATARGVSSAGAVVPLAEAAVLAVIGGDPSGVLPEATRTVVRERRARVLPLSSSDGEGDTMLACIATGAALAAASRAFKIPLEGAAVARVVCESIPGAELETAGARARRAFEAARDLLSAAARSELETTRPVGVA